MKCQKHNKEIVANCQWCGKELCRLCISKTDGKKAYCSSCSDMLGDHIKKKQIEKIQAEEEEDKRAAASQEYFNFSALRRP